MIDEMTIAAAPFYTMAVAVTAVAVGAASKVVYDMVSSADKLSITDMLSSVAAGLKKTP